jgi:hypothetical protein
MPRDWDKVQHPEERSPFHGKRNKDHGPHEHGLGAKPETPQGKAKNYIEPEGVELPSSINQDDEDALAALVTFPATFGIPWVPPVSDQDGKPQCVAYSSAYDQQQQDRPEAGRYLHFDKTKFFHQIGGTSQGASMTVALDRRVNFGYPVVTIGHAGAHRIRSYVRIANTVTSFKSALVNRKHGVLRIGPWYHSWYHPLASGKLPAPDYEVGWHATWFPGYNDTYGGKLENSWGTDYGKAGFAFMPYKFITREGALWTTRDR